MGKWKKRLSDEARKANRVAVQAREHQKLKLAAQANGLSVQMYRLKLHPERKWVRIITHVRRSSKTRGISCDLVPADLRDVYEKQDGKCTITGWPLTYGTGLTEPSSISVDRIDPGGGYTKSNIRLIAFMANVARNTWSDEQLFKFCGDVLKNRGKV